MPRRTHETRLAFRTSRTERLPDGVLGVYKKNKLMYTGSFGTVRATHHRFELCLETKAGHQRPCEAIPKTREFVDTHLQLQIDVRVIDQGKSEWAS